MYRYTPRAKDDVELIRAHERLGGEEAALGLLEDLHAPAEGWGGSEPQTPSQALHGGWPEHAPANQATRARAR